MNDFFVGVSNYEILNRAERVRSAEREIEAWAEDRERYKSYRKEWRKAAEEGYLPSNPLHVDIELSDACNLRCRMCTHGMGTADKGGFMDPELALHCIDESARIGVYSIKLNWRGEVSINNFLPQAVLHAKNKGILEVQINTNGLPIDPDIYVRCAKNRIDRIIFSVDGFSAYTYECIRVGGNYSRLMKNIHQLLDWKKRNGRIKPLVRVQMLRTKENAHEVPGFLEYWSPLVDDVSVSDEGNRGQGDSMIVGDQISVGRTRCSQPFQRMTIGRNGVVTPCCSDWDQVYKIGSINDSRLDTLWMNSRMQKMRRLQRNNEHAKLKSCRHCWTKESYLWKKLTK